MLLAPLFAKTSNHQMFEVFMFEYWLLVCSRIAEKKSVHAEGGKNGYKANCIGYSLIDILMDLL
jgi:hypothetical protein